MKVRAESRLAKDRSPLTISSQLKVARVTQAEVLVLYNIDYADL